MKQLAHRQPEEAVAGTDPGRSDTDGDGVSDATELSQGSDPLDATDGGAAPEHAATMAFPFRLHGDYAAWAMTVEGVRGDGRTLRLAMLTPGQAEDRTLLLRRGATYRIRLEWLGSPGHGDDLWYCWEARLGDPLLPPGRTFGDYDPTRLPGNEVLSGPGWYCENADGLLTTHVHTRETSGGNIAAGKTALLHILPAEPEFERDAVGVQCGTDRRVRVALTPESFSPDVQWTLSPVVENGPRLFAASNSVSGATSMSGVSNLWVSAGTVPGVYRVEASYPGCTNATATVYSVEVTLNHLWETSNPANRIFNPTYKDDKSDAGYQEHDPCTETTYGIHREKLYLASDPTDRFVFSLSLSVVPAEALLYASAVAYESATESHRRFSIGETGFSTLSVVADSSLESPEVIPIKVHFDFDGDNDIGPGDVESAIPVYDHPTTGETKNATVFGLGPTLIQLHEDAVRDMIGLYGIDPPVPSMISTCPRSFLLLFVDGVTNRMNSAFVPDEVEDVPFSSFLDEFSEWLTHNAGASFSDSGVATLKRYCWSTNSYLSHFLAERTPFVLKRRVANSIGYVEFPTETGTNLHQFVETTVLPQARLLLEDAPDGTVITLPSINTSYFFPTNGCLAFQSESPEWVPGSTIIVGQGAPGRGKWGAFINEYIGGGDQFQEFNANGTIGRGRVANLGYSFTIRKEINEGWLFADSTNYVVVSARVKCRIDDLYDFNYEDGEIAAHAAAMQIRYGNGSMVSSFNNNRQTPILEGHIFLDRIEIDHEYPYPFLYTSVLRDGSNGEHKSETEPTKSGGIIDK